MPAKPKIIIAHVEGSGTADVKMSPPIGAFRPVFATKVVAPVVTFTVYSEPLAPEVVAKSVLLLSNAIPNELPGLEVCNGGCDPGYRIDLVESAGVRSVKVAESVKG